MTEGSSLELVKGRDLRSSIDHPLSAFLDEIASLPRLNHRRIGLTLIRGAVVLASAAVCISIVAMNVAMFTAVLGLILSRPPLRLIPGFAIGAVFSGWIATTVIIAISAGTLDPTVRSSGLIHTWMIWLVAVIGFTDKRTIRAAVVAMAIAAVASASLAAAQFLGGLGSMAPFRYDPAGPRFLRGVGFFGIHLTQGYVFTIALLVFAATRDGSLGAYRIVGGACALAAVALSASRAACLALGVGIGAAIASRGSARHLVAGALVCALLLAGLVVFLGHVDGRLVRPSALVQDGRWAIWRTSLRIVREHPLVGVGGPEGFKRQYVEVYPRVEPVIPNEFPQGAPHAHNSFLSVAAEHGIPALLLYVGMIATMLVAIRRRQRSGSGYRLAVGVVAATFTAGCFEDVAGHSIPSYACFLALALAYSMRTAITGDDVARHEGSEGGDGRVGAPDAAAVMNPPGALAHG